MLVVEFLISAGCSVNCVSDTGNTPIMKAACEGHEQVVKKLILAGANPAVRTTAGDTALHYAAINNHIQCGILLAEEGADARSKNKLSHTPLDLAGTNFQEVIKQVLSFTTLCIFGNAENGKSTLIASLQAESTGFLGRFVNRFRRVNDHRKRTAGIEIVPYCSQKYGEVVFFDFAGQDEYHGPHQIFLECLLSKPVITVTLVLVIKVTETEEAILHQLHRWLTPVALTSITGSPQVIVIGSFLDKAKSKKEACDHFTRCIEVTRKDLKESPLSFVGTCFLNCRQPQSEGIDQLCSFLQDVPFPEFRATHTCYSLAWVLHQIRSSIKSQAVQLQDFSTWVKGNKDNLPQSLPAPEEVCQDISAAGHALYLPNKDDLLKSWLVLDLPGILHDVYGTLFLQHKDIVNDFGLLHCCHLARLFPKLDQAMVQQLLISLEFCIAVDPSVLKLDLSKLTQFKETSGWLFFPSLMSTKPPQSSSENIHKQNAHYLCWQLRTSKKHSISAHILQTILLRLAAHFVVKLVDKEGVQQHYCSIWWNGISWQSTAGVHISVYVRNNRVIQVLAASEVVDDLCGYLSEVVSDILSTVHRFSPRLTAAACIVYPPNVATSPEGVTDLPPKELFPVEGIRQSITEHKGFVFSQKDNEDWNTMSIADIFGGYIPKLEYIEKITWTMPEPNQPQSVVELNQPQAVGELNQPQAPSEMNQPEIVNTKENISSTDSRTFPSVAQALIGISTTPDMRDMDVLIVTLVAANWQRLALRLGVEGCLSEIVFKNHPNDHEGACRDMLNRWLRVERYTGEEERTWSNLLTALGRAGFVDLERRLQKEHVS